MRTKTLLLTAAVCAAGIATSKAQVYSVNAVGYVNTPLVKGYNMISNPLNNTATDGNTIGKLFASLPGGSVIYYFDAATAKYVSAQVDEFTPGEVTGPAASIVLAPGNGVFVGSPTAGTITFVGEVPQGTLSNPIPQGFSIKASQVPQAGTVTALGLTAPVDGTVIYNFDESTQTYKSFTYEFGAWSAEPSLQVGEAVFFSSPSATTWSRTFSVNQ
jgi:hypothetical protein